MVFCIDIHTKYSRINKDFEEILGDIFPVVSLASRPATVYRIFGIPTEYRPPDYRPNTYRLSNFLPDTDFIKIPHVGI